MMISEATWDQVADPRMLLSPDRITVRFPGRKLRLLSLSLAREVTHLIRVEEVLRGYELAEYVADLPEDHEEEEPITDLISLRRYRNNGPRPDEQALMAFCEAIGPFDESDSPYDYLDRYRCKDQPARTAQLVAFSSARAIAGAVPRDPASLAKWQSTFNQAMNDANTRIVSLSRCVLGNPFREMPPFEPQWRTPEVLLLAEEMYDSRDFSMMPILADAMEEAGCEQHDMLEHARYDFVHARGCWVLDAILGK